MNRSAIQREIRKKWGPRKKHSHKGDFGRVFILAGSQGMTGAAHLTAAAASRGGAGLVTLGVPEKIYPILARREAEVMVKPFPSTKNGAFSGKAGKKAIQFSKTQDVLALGPGISRAPEIRKFTERLLQDSNLPLVLDADALNALEKNPGILRKCRGRAILTPHPGEFQRVFGEKLTNAEILRKRKAAWVAKRFGVVLVLKGCRTIVADPEGRLYVNRTGNAGMAAGGTGDVLTGFIAALIGQKFSLWDAARFGVYLHGLAGDLAVAKTGEASLTASDLLNALPQAIKTTRGC